MLKIFIKLLRIQRKFKLRSYIVVNNNVVNIVYEGDLDNLKHAIRKLDLLDERVKGD